MKRGEKVQFDELKPGDVFEYENIRLMKFYKAHQFGPYVPYGAIGFSESSVCKCLGDDTEVIFLAHISDILPSFRPCTAQAELELVGPEEAVNRDMGLNGVPKYYLFWKRICIGYGNNADDFKVDQQSVVTPLIAEFDAREVERNVKVKVEPDCFGDSKTFNKQHCRERCTSAGCHYWDKCKIEVEKKAKPKKENAYEVGEWVKPTAGGLPYKIAEVVTCFGELTIYRSIKGRAGTGYTEYVLRLATDDEIKRAEAKQPKYEVEQWVVTRADDRHNKLCKAWKITGRDNLNWPILTSQGHSWACVSDDISRLATDDEIKRAEAKQLEYEVGQWVVVRSLLGPSKRFSVGTIKRVASFMGKHYGLPGGQGPSGCWWFEAAELGIPTPREITQAKKEIRDKELCLEAREDK